MEEGFKGDSVKNKEYIYNALIEDGFTHAAAMGIIGNIQHETGNFKYTTEIAPNRYGQKGIGILQWSGVRAKEFKEWLTKNNKDLNSIQDNVEYLLSEMKKKHRHHWTKGMSYDKLKKIDSIEEATKVFMDTYLRPDKKKAGFKQRLAYAKQEEQPSKASKNAKYIGLDENLLEQKKDRIPKNPSILDKGINTVLQNIDFSQSTISPSDFNKLESKTANFLITKGDLDDGEDEPMNKLIKSAYKQTNPITIGELLENFDSSLPIENTQVPDMPENKLVLGGFIQPNGRVSTMTRAEDLIAQNKTS